VFSLKLRLAVVHSNYGHCFIAAGNLSSVSRQGHEVARGLLLDIVLERPIGSNQFAA
jgi:hypothetical protein